MPAHHDPRLLCAFLEEVSRRLERQERVRPWRDWVRPVLGVPVALGLSLMATHCGGESEDGPVQECTDSVECVDLCADGVDNDRDGDIDCDDADCEAICHPATPVYGAPMEDCENQVDDDSDGDIDCEDSDCVGLPACTYTPEYGEPMPVEYCDDGVDNDGDGDIDCADGDCDQFATCQGLEYGLPFESDCDDGVDNDGDNAVDCADLDCADDSACVGLRYGIPL